MTTSTNKAFFDVQSDYARLADQWFLTEPRAVNGSVIDAREFVEGIPYHGSMPASIPIRKPGREVAFHLAAFDMPVVSTDVAAIISRIAPYDIECFPINIQGAKNSYAILNAICRLDCLDEGRSEFTRWKEEDGRPDRLGQFHVISTIRVNTTKTGSHHLFRLADWPLALLVSDTLRNASLISQVWALNSGQLPDAANSITTRSEILNWHVAWPEKQLAVRTSLMTKHRARLTVGDLLEIPIGEAFAYVVYIGRHVEYGDAIWVVPRTFKHRPADFADIFARTGYLTFYPAKSAVSQKLVDVVGASGIEQLPEVPRHLRRAGARARTGEILAWVVERDGVDTLRKQLSEDEKKLPIAAIWNHEFLLERIAEGWTPEMEG